ncbi:hypothetical protein ACFV98_29820 [Streptomyces violascens]|uniref:hypothetical protein n=1 Tax=Streptomyces violascens TaxID=67381 RepID=UPI0036684B37
MADLWRHGSTGQGTTVAGLVSYGDPGCRDGPLAAPRAPVVIAASPVDETQDDSHMPEMMRTLDHLALHHLADVVSMSFGSVEENFNSPRNLRSCGQSLDRARARA